MIFKQLKVYQSKKSNTLNMKGNKVPLSPPPQPNRNIILHCKNGEMHSQGKTYDVFHENYRMLLILFIILSC